MRKSKVRKLRITAKILIPTTILLAVICMTIGYYSYSYISTLLIDIGMEESMMAANIAAGSIDGDLLQLVEPGDSNSREYVSIKMNMNSVKETCGIKYLYTLYTDGSTVFYGIDTDTENPADYGDVFEVAYEEMAPVFSGESLYEDYIDVTEYGHTVSSYLPILNSDGEVVGAVGCDYDAETIVNRLNAVFKNMLIISIGCLLVSILILEIIIRRVSSPIGKVENKIYELVNNEGDLTQKLDIHSGDELELVSNNINQLLEYIRNIMLSILDNSVILKDSSESVVENLNKSQSHLSEVSAAMEQMNAAMEENSASVNRVNEAIQSVHGEIDDINSNALSGSQSSEKIMEKAVDIYTNAKIEQEQAIEQSEDMIKSLREKIEKSKSAELIETLTEDIISITEQTNLLALNASIEAARAGDAGRGFAVVADEIGKLAASSAKTAEEIRNVSVVVLEAVNALAAEAEEMVEFMEKVAMGGYGRLIETSDSYRSDVEHMNELLILFAKKSAQLKKEMDEVKIGVEAINSSVEESAFNVTSVTELATNIAEEVVDIDDLANRNLGIADKLNDEVNRFKL